MENNTQPISSKKPKRKKILLIMLAVFIVGAVIGFSYLYLSDPSRVTVYPDIELDQKISEARTMVNNGKVSEAIAYYDQEAESTKNLHNKSVLLVSKAGLYIREGNYDEALLAAKEAESFEENGFTSGALGSIYELQGNTALAIEYYKKTTTYLNESDPDLEIFKNKIISLGGEY